MFEIDPTKLDTILKQRKIKRGDFMTAIGEHKTNYAQWMRKLRRIPRTRYAVIGDVLGIDPQSLAAVEPVRQNRIPVLFLSVLKTFPAPLFPSMDWISAHAASHEIFPDAEKNTFLLQLDLPLLPYPPEARLLIRLLDALSNGTEVLMRTNADTFSTGLIHTDPTRNQLLFFPADAANPVQIFGLHDTGALWLMQIVQALHTRAANHTDSAESAPPVAAANRAVYSPDKA